MEAENLMLYKLMILFLLDNAKFPLANTHISNFILDKGYTNYFNVQRSMWELIEEEFIMTSVICNNNTIYKITKLGKETLYLFDNLISTGIKEDIHDYLKENHYQLRNEVSTVAFHYPTKNDDYIVNLKVLENNSPIIELNLEVSTEEDAIRVCNNWKKKSADVYSSIMFSLLK